MDEKIKKLREYFGKQEKIAFAYLFGSVAKGEAGKLSDIDIAIFIDERLEKDERNYLQLKVLSDLINILNTDKIDIVVMNELGSEDKKVDTQGRIIIPADWRKRDGKGK